MIVQYRSVMVMIADRYSTYSTIFINHIEILPGIYRNLCKCKLIEIRVVQYIVYSMIYDYEY